MTYSSLGFGDEIDGPSPQGPVDSIHTRGHALVASCACYTSFGGWQIPGI